MTDTIGSTPQPSRPEPGSEPGRSPRFRLPEPPQGSEDQAASQPTRPPLLAPRVTATAPRGIVPRGAASGLDSQLKAMTAPEGRYGAERRGMSMPRKIGLVVIGLVILGGVAGYIGWQQANPTIQGTVTKFNASGTSVQVTFEVDKPADKSATCMLVAEDVHGSVIGSAAVPILPGRAKNVQSYTLQTTVTANTVIVQTCQLTS